MGVIHDAVRRLVTRGRPPVRCSACGRAKTTTNRLISGRGVYLCQTCVEGAPRPPKHEAGLRLRCRFCGEQWSPAEVTQIGEVVACTECLRLMDDMLAEAAEQHQGR